MVSSDQDRADTCRGVQLGSAAGADQNDYFDEAYFQRGDERGTAYRDYARSASLSPTFREIAEAIKYVFEPRRCLEIGCATGAIVRHLNEIGIETHGIDVSTWAIENRLHENVTLAGADDLPFEDDGFDFVYSSHALEHIPSSLLEDAIREISRVASPDAHQFHMLPIVGTYPYDYDEELARQNLQADPTHNILQPMAWWTDRWHAAGWAQLPINVLLFNDLNGAELSSGQFTLSRVTDDSPTMNSAFEWNRLVHRKQFKALERIADRMSKPLPLTEPGRLNASAIGSGIGEWCDYERLFTPPISVEGCTFDLAVDLESAEPRPLRIALIDDSEPERRGVLEFWSEFQPGLSAITVPIDRFTVLEGDPHLDRIDKLFLGGKLSGAQFRVVGTVSWDGRSIPL